MFVYCTNKDLAMKLMKSHKLIQSTTDSNGKQIWIFNNKALSSVVEDYSHGEDYYTSKRLNF